MSRLALNQSDDPRRLKLALLVRHLDEAVLAAAAASANGNRAMERRLETATDVADAALGAFVEAVYASSAADWSDVVIRADIAEYWHVRVDGDGVDERYARELIDAVHRVARATKLPRSRTAPLLAMAVERWPREIGAT